MHISVQSIDAYAGAYHESITPLPATVSLVGVPPPLDGGDRARTRS